MPGNFNDDWYEQEKLHFAIRKGDLKEAQNLIDQGYDINGFDMEGNTPLLYAASENNLDAVKFLLDLGADVNAHDEEKIAETPLGQVAQNCTYEMARTLIDAGADPTIPGWMQITALDRAEERKKPEGVRVYELLKKASKK